MPYVGQTITDVFPTSVSLDTVTASTSLKTPLVEFTDGDNALSIADGGTVTFTQVPVNAGGGKVLQVQTLNETADTGTITSTSVQTLMSLAITPSATTSKILILSQAVIEIVGGSNALVSAPMFRGSISGTQISAFIYDGTVGIASGNTHYNSINHCLVDSPNTTSATTYTFAFSKGSGGTTSVRQAFGNRTMTLIEIGA